MENKTEIAAKLYYSLTILEVSLNDVPLDYKERAYFFSEFLDKKEKIDVFKQKPEEDFPIEDFEALIVELKQLKSNRKFFDALNTTMNHLVRFKESD